MIHPEIDWEICQNCEPCYASLVCKTRAIVKFDPDEPVYIDYSRCTNCSLCILACPCAAIHLNSTNSGE